MANEEGIAQIENLHCRATVNRICLEQLVIDGDNTVYGNLLVLPANHYKMVLHVS